MARHAADRSHSAPVPNWTRALCDVAARRSLTIWTQFCSLPVDRDPAAAPCGTPHCRPWSILIAQRWSLPVSANSVRDLSVWQGGLCRAHAQTPRGSTEVGPALPSLDDVTQPRSPDILPSGARRHLPPGPRRTQSSYGSHLTSRVIAPGRWRAVRHDCRW